MNILRNFTVQFERLSSTSFQEISAGSHTRTTSTRFNAETAELAGFLQHLLGNNMLSCSSGAPPEIKSLKRPPRFTYNISFYLERYIQPRASHGHARNSSQWWDQFPFLWFCVAPPCCVLSFEYWWGTECSWVHAIHSPIGSHECPRPFVRGRDCCCQPSMSAWIHFGCNQVIRQPWSYLFHGQCSFTLVPRDKHIFQLHVTCSQRSSWFGHTPPLLCMNCRRAMSYVVKLNSMYWKTFPYLSKKGVSIWVCELPSRNYQQKHL